ncbi:MAG: hypothetical protein EOM62_20710 [Bacteroidia bacterium]|nr:hypothetical protein [Bacteroidia bacterium]
MTTNETRTTDGTDDLKQENFILRANCFGLLRLVQENAEVLERIRELVDMHGAEDVKARLSDTGIYDVYVSDIGALNCVRSAGIDVGGNGKWRGSCLSGRVGVH